MYYLASDSNLHKTTTVQIKEVIQHYSSAIALQRQLQEKAEENPGQNLSFDEVTAYLKAVADEREAEAKLATYFSFSRVS